MFKAQSQGVYVPSKSQSVKPDVVSDVLPNEQIRMLIPSFVGFVDPQESYMKFNVKLSGVRGQPVPDPVCGIHSLFRNWVVRDGGNTATLETLEDYNAMVATLHPYTHQSSIEHLRELFSGTQTTENQNGASLFYGAPVSLAGADANTPAEGVRELKTPQIQFRPMLGSMATTVVPVSLLNGIRMTIDTEDPLRALRYLSQKGTKLGAEESATNIVTISTALAIGDNNRTGNAGHNQQFFAVTTDIDTTDAGINNPFSVGDFLYRSDPTPAPIGENEEKLGYIIGFYNDGGKLAISYVPQRNVGAGLALTSNANSRVYVKGTEREVAHTGIIGKDDLANVGTVSVGAPSYTLSNIEYLCQTVQPPASYVEGQMKKAMTEQGIQIDYLSCDLYRHNQSNTQGIVQAQIPTLATRGKSVICQPLPVQFYRTMDFSSFSGIPDSARNYQFVFGSSLIPSRPANLERYSQATPRNEALHTSELQKALVNIGRSVFNLQRIQDHFLIARGFNKYGQITDLAEQTLSLRVDYSANAGFQKIFNNFVWSLKRLIVSKGQVRVEN
jgi:hypothetical protein